MNLKELRNQIGKTQQELARDMGCSIQQIQKVEQDPTKLTFCSYYFVHDLWFNLIVENDDTILLSLSDFVARVVSSAMEKKFF